MWTNYQENDLRFGPNQGTLDYGLQMGGYYEWKEWILRLEVMVDGVWSVEKIEQGNFQK